MKPTLDAAQTRRTSRLPAPAPLGVVIERVSPSVDAGRFPVKRIVGEPVQVSADIIGDGPNRVGARLSYRSLGPRAEWQDVVMRETDDDRWTAVFTPLTLGSYEFTVTAWIDRFATWRHALTEPAAAGRVDDRDLADGALYIRRLMLDAAPGTAAWLDAQARRLEGAAPIDLRIAAALDQTLQRRLADIRSPDGIARSDAFPVVVERQRARFGAWYEMFPRSAGTDPTRSATLEEAAERLPDIAGMGFDVLYLPPIHPIGLTDRKGRHGRRPARAEDPGSPWAVGSAEGGHFDIEPGLGTLEDFDRFVARAREVGLEIALDLAVHCSPDHPYVREHPEWFPRHADGSLRHAENLPKQYEDIRPLLLDGPHWRSLYDEIRRIVEFWIGHGVTIFRADNPHTKPFAFWEWLLTDVRRDHPDVVFLSEAFTRPMIMRHLAKLGFSQSYTYFMWRTTKRELVSYFEELTRPNVHDYFRPNLFVNTPDVLPAGLQTGAREAFEARLILAATLGAAYGLYSGFELCEHEAVPGTEEYLHSEKFEYQARNWKRPGHIKGLVARLNEIRRTHPALQWDRGLRFHDTDDDHILCYSKRSPDGTDLVVVAVSLDPTRPHSAAVELPIEDWGAPSGSVRARDLLGDVDTVWSNRRMAVALGPGNHVARIWHVVPAGERLDRSGRKVLQ